MMNYLVCYNNNKQDITENIDSANKSVTQADNVCNRSRQIYSKLKKSSYSTGDRDYGRKFSGE